MRYDVVVVYVPDAAGLYDLPQRHFEDVAKR